MPTPSCVLLRPQDRSLDLCQEYDRLYCPLARIVCPVLVFDPRLHVCSPFLQPARAALGLHGDKVPCLSKILPRRF